MRKFGREIGEKKKDSHERLELKRKVPWGSLTMWKVARNIGKGKKKSAAREIRMGGLCSERGKLGLEVVP